MKKHSLVLAAIGFLLILTNPNQKSEFVKWQKTKFCQRFEQSYATTACHLLMVTQADNINKVLDIATEQKNLVFFSLYQTNLVGIKTTTLGISGNYITLNVHSGE